jgi:hypothetical protein
LCSGVNELLSIRAQRRPVTLSGSSANFALKKIIMNRISLFLAFAFYILGMTMIIDWFIYWEYNYNNDFNELKVKYYDRFPDLLQTILQSRLSAVFFILTFIYSGIIFIKRKHIIYKILGITAFILAFWNLFSIM